MVHAKWKNIRGCQPINNSWRDPHLKSSRSLQENISFREEKSVALLVPMLLIDNNLNLRKKTHPEKK